MDWVFYKGQEFFGFYRKQWDELNASINNHVLLDSAIWEELIKHFADGKTLLGISQSQEYPGMVLVEPEGFGMWRTFQPSQAPIGPILLQNTNNLQGQLKGILRNLPGYALGLGVTQQDPNFSDFRSLSTHESVEVKEYMKTARIEVKGDFEEYWSSRGQDLRKNIRKRLARLEREGLKPFLDVHHTPENMPGCIQHYGLLEQSGWKGRRGTAVTPHNVQGRFYASMLERVCHAREGVIYSLRFNDKIVAQKICLRRNNMMVFLKMAYDEKYRQLSPGYILQYEILKRLFEDQQIHYVETYGRVKEGWTDKWTDDFRIMYHLNYFRHMGLILAKNMFGGRVTETQEVG